MKKVILTLFTLLAVSGCNSISAEGDYGSITIKDKEHSHTHSKTKKSNGNAYGHNNPNNPHYKN